MRDGGLKRKHRFARRFGWVTTIATLLCTRIALGWYPAGISVSTTVNFNGWNITADSFNSTNALFSDNGMYPINYPDRQRDHGDIVTTSSQTNALVFGNSLIKGTVHTGPGATVSLDTNGSVGDMTWVMGGNTGIEAGHAADDVTNTFLK
jgi:hypothetical protein